jgi:hypothetical protein
MPFRPQLFEESVVAVLGRPLPEALADAAVTYASATTPVQKARCVGRLMAALDAEVEAGTGREIMDRCACIGQGVIDKALGLQRESADLDDLLARMNALHIGGGQLRALLGHPSGEIAIAAAYDHCYCGSVNKARAPISATYCACSCGWYRRLFEALLGRPVEVELQSSIIQGDAQCRFVIHTL